MKYVSSFTLENGITDVKKESKDKGKAIEAILPGVRVYPCEDCGENEEDDVDKEGKVDSRFGAKLMSE